MIFSPKNDFFCSTKNDFFENNYFSAKKRKIRKKNIFDPRKVSKPKIRTFSRLSKTKPNGQMAKFHYSYLSKLVAQLICPGGNLANLIRILIFRDEIMRFG